MLLLTKSTSEVKKGKYVMMALIKILCFFFCEGEGSFCNFASTEIVYFVNSTKADANILSFQETCGLRQSLVSTPNRSNNLNF